MFEEQHGLLRDISRLNALCVTGHRPEKLPGGKKLECLKKTLYYYLEYAVKQGYTHFFDGLADGIDFYAAEYLFRLRETNPELCVIGVQPSEDYEAFFRKAGYDLERLHIMQQNVDRLVVLPQKSWMRGAFLRRNSFMVDHCMAVLAVCSGDSSGSLFTFRHGIKQGLAGCRISPTPPGGGLPEPSDWQVERIGF